MEWYDSSKLLSTIGRLVQETETALRKKGKKRVNIPDLCLNNEFPVSSAAWGKYVGFVNKKGKPAKGHSINNMDISTLYDFCEFTDVSADYLLGFNDTPVKQASAEQIQKDFGLSDDALRCLNHMLTHSSLTISDKDNRYSELNFIDFLIVNFAGKFLDSISTYFGALDAFEDYAKKYFDPAGKLKRKYSIEEDRLVDEYQKFEAKVDLEKFSITQQVDRFLLALRQELSKKEAPQE